MTRSGPALCALAILFLILLSACSAVEAAPLSAKLLAEDAGLSPAQAFGEPDALVAGEPDFAYLVLYPISGFETLDAALREWAGQAVADAIAARTLSDDGRLGGELLVRYEAHRKGDRLMSVAEVGQYVSRGSAEALDFVKTFHYDSQADRMLSAIDLFPYTGHPQLFALIESELATLNPGLDAARLEVNASWLEPAVLTAENVQLILRANRLGLENWPARLIFSYDELEGLLVLPGEQPEADRPDTLPPSDLPGLPDPPTTQPEGLDPDKPMIALTFDDGPSAVTGKLLDLLERHNVPATFFMIGRQVGGYADTVARMAAQGCELASHSWDHPNLSKLGRDSLASQLTHTADAIEAAGGLRPVLVRPPYGEANQTVRAVAEELGFYLVNWSVDTLDWRSRNAQAVYEHILANAEDGAIILCHDLYESTYEAMELAIPALLEQGYQLVTVSQLLEIEAGNRVPGVVYRHR